MPAGAGKAGRQAVDSGDRVAVPPDKPDYETLHICPWAVEFIGHEIKAKLKVARLLTVYLGGDATDEDAFKVVHRPEGWGVYVGGENEKSAAGYFLDSPQEVEELLGRLINLKER